MSGDDGNVTSATPIVIPTNAQAEPHEDRDPISGKTREEIAHDVKQNAQAVIDQSGFGMFPSHNAAVNADVSNLKQLLYKTGDDINSTDIAQIQTLANQTQAQELQPSSGSGVSTTSNSKNSNLLADMLFPATLLTASSGNGMSTSSGSGMSTSSGNGSSKQNSFALIPDFLLAGAALKDAGAIVSNVEGTSITSGVFMPGPQREQSAALSA